MGTQIGSRWCLALEKGPVVARSVFRDKRLVVT